MNRTSFLHGNRSTEKKMLFNAFE